MSRSELKAEAEGSEQLELLRELEWTSGTLWTVAFPAFEAPPPVVAACVAIIVYHVQHVVLHELSRLCLLIIWTVDVQVIVDGHFHRVLSTEEPVDET